MNSPSSEPESPQMGVLTGSEVQQEHVESPHDAVFAAVGRYLQTGWFVLPADPVEKRPLVRYVHRTWKQPSLQEWQRWRKRWPNCAVGVVTGTPSRGLLVVDVDDEAAARSVSLSCPPTFGA